MAKRKAFSSRPVRRAVAVVRAFRSLRLAAAVDGDDGEGTATSGAADADERPKSRQASDCPEPRRLEPARTTLCTSSVTMASLWRQSGNACQNAIQHK